MVIITNMRTQMSDVQSANVKILCIFFVLTCATSVAGTRGSKVMIRCLEDERRALLKFRQGVVDDTNSLSSWSSTECDCCEWRGVTCDDTTGHVVGLDLSNNIRDYQELPLAGNITYASSLLELRNLRYLNLSYNNFDGPEIPKYFGAFRALEDLKLASAGFTGPIPGQLRNLSTLKVLDLSGNNLSVDNLDWFSGLSSLRYLDMTYVNLAEVVSWPESVSKLPSLLVLNLYACNLPNINSRSLHLVSNSSSLRFLDLTGNNLSSSVLPWVANLSRNLIDVRLGMNNFEGPIPDIFTNLGSIGFLDLSYNQFQGGITKSFRHLCHLESLYLTANRLSNSSLENLSCSKDTLKFLDLRHNPLHGTFPDFSSFSSLTELYIDNTSLSMSPKNFGQHSKLEYLSSTDNQLSGPLPDFTSLSSLKFLYLDNNQLSGSIPESLGQLSNLQWLSLPNNLLEGVISKAHLFNLSYLYYLDISKNSLSLDLDPDTVPPIDLTDLYMASCKVGPDFPKWLKTQTKLQMLNMARANIADSIPDWFWDPASPLRQLDLSFNQIRGKLPSNLSANSNLSDIDLSSNNLHGPLPPFPPDTTRLILSKNRFSGPITSLCEAHIPLLTQLDLSDNRLSGELPDCWMQLERLELLNLANNRFAGKLPGSLGYLSNIGILHLNNNTLSGEMPSLENCKWLGLLDLGDNRITGRLPEWLGRSLEHLSVLRLRSNEFYGSIPTGVCNLQALQILDLSSNNLSGVLPQCLSNMTTMASELSPNSYTDFVNLMWKGIEREFGTNLVHMRSIDISRNRLSGEIPQSITLLLKLKSLDLSRNNFSGSIPSDLGYLDDLESLDLSLNHLSGAIPSSFSRFHFLQNLNLSYNMLTGRIPSSTQLQSFEASAYVGNAGLFGPPLTRNVPREEKGQHPYANTLERSEDQDHEDGFITTGFYLSLAIGFIVGFWGSCSALLLRRSWRHAYFRFLNSAQDKIAWKSYNWKHRLNGPSGYGES